MRLPLFAALLFASFTAFAQPYIFAGLAWTNTSAPSGTESENSSDIFVLPGVGYRFSRHIAVEAAYLRPGEVASSFTQSQPAPGVSNVTTSTFELSGARLSLVGTLPIAERFAALASVSAYRLKGERRDVDTVTTSAPPAVTVTGERSFSETGTTFGIGAGLSSTITDSLEGRAMLDFIRGKDDLFGEGSDLKTMRVVSFS